MFEGTLRDNLDPRHAHDDTELWAVLGHARLKEHVASMEGQLDTVIQEGGNIFHDSSTICYTILINHHLRFKSEPGTAAARFVGSRIANTK